MGTGVWDGGGSGVPREQSSSRNTPAMERRPGPAEGRAALPLSSQELLWPPWPLGGPMGRACGWPASQVSIHCPSRPATPTASSMPPSALHLREMPLGHVRSTGLQGRTRRDWTGRCLCYFRGFPGGPGGKASTCRCTRRRFDRSLGRKVPGRRHRPSRIPAWGPLGTGDLKGYSPGRRELAAAEQLSRHVSLS